MPVTAGSIEAKTFLLDVILPSIESNLDEAISERSDVFHSMLLEADDVWGEAVSTGNSQFFWPWPETMAVGDAHYQRALKVSQHDPPSAAKELLRSRLILKRCAQSAIGPEVGRRACIYCIIGHVCTYVCNP